MYKPLTDQEQDEVQRFCRIKIHGVELGISDIRKVDEPHLFWMSDWSRVDELTKAGFLRSHNHGPSTYGHVSHYVQLNRCVPFMTNEQLEAGVKRFTLD